MNMHDDYARRAGRALRRKPRTMGVKKSVTHMTDTQIELLRRFAWLCHELAHGNGFSQDNYLQWADAALREVRQAIEAAGVNENVQ